MAKILGVLIDDLQFTVDEVTPTLNVVQSVLKIPKASRNSNGREAIEFESVCETYKKLVKPQGAIFQVDSIKVASEVLFPNCQSLSLCKRFNESVHPYLFLATIGNEVGNKSEELMSKGEYLGGTLLDAFGSAGVEMVVDLLQNRAGFLLSTMLAKEVKCVRFSPGYGNWELKVQSHFLKILDGEKMGVTLNDSYMFIPHKTVSGIIVPK